MHEPFLQQGIPLQEKTASGKKQTLRYGELTFQEYAVWQNKE
jgi:hypothetical protein